MAKIVTFGELLLRLSPEGLLRFSQTPRLELTFGGAETNVAVSLANLGEQAALVTKLPRNAIADRAISELRRFGVDTSKILRGGERVGIYYLEKGADARPSVCVYDRKYSSLSAAEPDEFDWDSILDGADALVFSGITPALGANLVECCRRAALAARRRGALVFCDTNFRATLWPLEEASATMSELLALCDVVVSNAGLANDMFALGVPFASGELLDRDDLEAVARVLCSRFGCKAAALTQRESVSSNFHRFEGAIYSDGEFALSRKYEIDIVDRVGGGDAFCAGAVLAILEKMPPRDACEFAAANSVLAHTVEGDFALASRAEVERLARGGDSRIRR